MSFTGPYPYGTPGGDEVVAAPQIPPVIRTGLGNSSIIFLHVNGRLVERLRENVEDVVRILGLSGQVLVAIITREDSVVRDANTSDLDFQDAFTLAQIAPGVVTVEIKNAGISSAMLQNALIQAIHLAPFAVTNGALATDSVDARVIAPATITAAEIAPGVITPAGITLLSEDVLSGTAKSVNGVFSAAYDAYVIEGFVTLGTASFGVNFRLRKAGVDLSGSVYTAQGNITTNPANAGTNVAFGQTRTFLQLIPSYTSGTVSDMYFKMEMQGPAATRTKNGIHDSSGIYAGQVFARNALSHTIGDSTAHDGFTIYSSATMTAGVVRTYGKRNTP